MKLLLDTNAVIWSMVRPERIPSIAIDAIEDKANDVFVSVVSAWEIEIKAAKGRLELPSPLKDALAAQSFEPLTVAMRHVHAVESLPRHHFDPFDRMIIAQAHLDGMTVITSDSEIRRYPVAVLPI